MATLKARVPNPDWSKKPEHAHADRASVTHITPRAAAPATLQARIPDIDWSKGFERYWCGGSVSLTHTYNAFSLLLPVGEQFFRDTARDLAKSLDLSNNPALEKEVREFVVQESLHSAQHRRFNEVLERQGFKNVVEPNLLWWKSFGYRYLSPLTNMAAVCAYEHLTSIMSEEFLRAPGKWTKNSPDMALFWGWHAAEETEHKAVCFDLYKAAGGGYLRRAISYLIVLLGFNFLFFMRSYLYLRRTDKHLEAKAAVNKEPTKFALTMLLGPARYTLGAVLHYLSPSFHPWQRDNRARMEEWLRDNHSRLKLVGRTAAVET